MLVYRDAHWRWGAGLLPWEWKGLWMYNTSWGEDSEQSGVWYQESFQDIALPYNDGARDNKTSSDLLVRATLGHQRGIRRKFLPQTTSHEERREDLKGESGEELV